MSRALADLFASSVPWAAFTVIVPLGLALLAVLLGKRATRLVRYGAVATSIVAFAATIQVVLQGPVDHVVGGWAPPLGIRLRLDGLAAAFLLVTAVVALSVTAAPGETFREKGLELRRGYVFWPLLYTTWAGLNALFVSADVFNLYVALELISLSAVALVTLDGKAAGLVAAMRYLLFALLGSLAFLTGTVLLYSAYGVLDMQMLASRVTRGDYPAVVASALMIAGLIAKTALFPLHAWLPPAHAAAPAPASALLSALVVKGSFYVIVRLWFDALPQTATVASAQLLGALGAGGIVWGSVLALRQKRLKMVIAYSTVAQLGYLFVMIPLAGGSALQQAVSASAWTGGMLHALVHAPAKAAMFLAAGHMMACVGHDRLDGLVGVVRVLPITTFAFGLSAVSLMGLPPSGGFTAKYLLLTSAFASGQWWWAAVIIAGGFLAAAYLFRVLERFLAEPDQPVAVAAVPAREQLVVLALAALAIALGLVSQPLYDLLQIGRPGAMGGAS